MFKFQAEHIRIGRIAKQMTQQQLADAIGVSCPTIRKWERGGSAPDAIYLADLANALNVDVNYFYANVRE